MRLPILTERDYDFSNLGASATADVILVKALDVVPYRSGQLLVRVHGATWSAVSPQDVYVRAYMTAPCIDDPNQDFVATATQASTTLSDSGGGSTGGDLLVGDLTAGFGSHLRIVLEVSQTGAAEPLQFSISADLELNEEP